MLNIFNFFIFIFIIHLSLLSNFKNNSIMYLSAIEIIWINLILIVTFLINFFDNINFFSIILFIFILASLELSLVLLYIYLKK